MPIFRIALAALAAFIVAGGAAAQSGAFPSKPIRLVVPFAPGGPADALGRIVGADLAVTLGQPVVIENRAGAGGAIGAEFVSKAAPDGHTLLMGNVGDTMAVSLYKSLPYDYARQFAPVSLLASSPFIIVTHPSVAAQNVSELIQLAKAKPNTLTYGSAGIGVGSHLAGELFKQMAGIEITHVPYKGQGPATADLLGGQIAFMFNNPLVSLPLVQSGKLRALAVTSKTRLAAAPNIPTVSESGLPAYESGTWFSIMVPAGTPAAAVNALAAGIAKSMSQKETREKLAAQGVEAVGSTPAELGRLVQSDIAKWADVIKRGNIKPE